MVLPLTSYGTVEGGNRRGARKRSPVGGDGWPESEEVGGYDDLRIQMQDESIRRGTALWQPSVHEWET
jgi:hypothetical protein